MNKLAELKVFLSYSHKDMEIKNQIESTLLKTTGFDIFSDNLIKAGSVWSKELMKMRAEADVFLLLVSNAYLNSQTVLKEELPQIIQRGESDAYIIPFILERCNWKEREFSKYQALPKFGKPLLEFSNKEEAYLQVTEALFALADLKQNRKAVSIIEQEKKERTTTLDLSNCNLAFIPVDLLQMSWLKALILARNQIRKIENLENLTDLEKLSLAKNEIHQIENVEQLTNLTYLDFQNNYLTQIENLQQNINLRVLGLSSNRLESLVGIGHLHNLEALYVGHNQVKDLEPLAALSQLKRIVLTNNQITSIKPLLNHIKSGLKVALQYSYDENDHGIFIKDNRTLSEPSIEVVEKGRDAVLKYFGDAETYGTKKLEVVKLILVGNSKVGKTNLSEFLRGQTITDNHNSTHLLDIQYWHTSFSSSDDDKLMRVNIFDFGGQDYYHDSHRMYYSHDTGYILLWDTNTNKYAEETEPGDDPANSLVYENFPLEYWLESINYNLIDKRRNAFNAGRRDESKISQSAYSAPVLILQNKIDIAEGKLNQQVLCNKYENIFGFFNMSLKEQRRTAVLFEVLNDYMSALNLSGRMLIEYEHLVISHYMNEERPFEVITLEQFCEACVGIINDSRIPFNKADAGIIAEILNSIGILFYDKQSETDGIIFTQIKRLNDIIKEVMDIAKKGNEKGIFYTSDVAHIPHREEILKLLCKNNSIILINEGEFLVPQFLPVRPEPAIEFFLHAFTFHQVRFLYKAYFHKTLLLSLFSKYLTSTLPVNTTIVKNLPFWRNGIIVSRGEGSNKQMVLVEFVKMDSMGIVNIKTIKPFDKRGLEKDIENTLDELNKGWTVTKEISVNGVDFFNVAELKKEVANQRFEFYSNGKVFSVNDFKHITDFEKLPKKIFISYSSKNAEFIKRFVTHLEVLKSSAVIDPWYDRMIESGTKWDDAIAKEMNNSDVIIFLLSPDFLATEYIMKTEIPMAIEQIKNEKSKFFFIELQPCGWARTEISNYQQTDDSGESKKNVILIERPDNDRQWNLVINELEKKLQA